MPGFLLFWKISATQMQEDMKFIDQNCVSLSVKILIVSSIISKHLKFSKLSYFCNFILFLLLWLEIILT